MVRFNISGEDDQKVVLSFELEGGIVSPSEIPDIVGDPVLRDEIPFDKGIVVSGRGPVWLYAALVHALHPARWVGTFDPRLGGGVVVARHHHDAPSLGTVVPIEG